jgi:hypothetical protein
MKIDAGFVIEYLKSETEWRGRRTAKDGEMNILLT